MKLKILLCGAVLFFPAIVQAQSNSTITIIHDDGSKDVVDLKKPEQPVKDVPDVGSPTVREAPVVEAPTVETAPVEVADEPEVAPVAKPEPVKKVVKKAAKKSVPKKKAAPQPEPAPRVVTPPPTPIQREALEQGRVITKAMAISAALDYAPPASDMDVFRSSYEGQTVYAVVFKTEDGYHEVLVDPVNGKVLESRESTEFSKVSKPGYLAPKLSPPKPVGAP